MNTKIGHIACHQSHLGRFAPSPTPKSTEDSSDGGDEGDDGSGSSSDDEMATFNDSPFVTHDKKGK